MSYRDIEKLDKDQLLDWKQRIEERLADYEEGEKKIVWQVGTAEATYKSFREEQFLDALEYLKKVPYEKLPMCGNTIDTVNAFLADRTYFTGVKKVMPEMTAKLYSPKEYEEIFADESQR
ncbi:hypothetical protein [Entomomonas asaccharolytica]|uniref:Uncharacterized protein n=1 Tax=Entomomonas asaccharolytica TaxID=2785331 RepID=A0A974NI41_9GAMM|nr:hypothetical protein [Entomomonas asaccharolytica]QQP86963.1 hypothetical protein JHT90_06875 [Entomomonas asaccharolytica]